MCAQLPVNQLHTSAAGDLRLRELNILSAAPTTAPPLYKQNKRANAALLPLVSSNTPPPAPPRHPPGAPPAHPAAVRRFGGRRRNRGAPSCTRGLRWRRRRRASRARYPRGGGGRRPSATPPSQALPSAPADSRPRERPTYTDALSRSGTDRPHRPVRRRGVVDRPRTSTTRWRPQD